MTMSKYASTVTARGRRICLAAHCSSTLALLVLLALAMAPVHADAPVVRRRCALVVGNGDYRGHKHMVRLKHPPTDARAVALALQGVGFTVHLVTNAGA